GDGDPGLAEERGDLGLTVAVEVRELEHLALGRLEPCERRPRGVPLARRRACRRGGGRGRSLAGRACALAPRRLERPPVHEPEQPGRRLLPLGLERRRAAPAVEERGLDDGCGAVVVAGHPSREPVGRRAERVVESGERDEVAPGAAGDERLAGIGRLLHWEDRKRRPPTATCEAARRRTPPACDTWPLPQTIRCPSG